MVSSKDGLLIGISPGMVRLLQWHHITAVVDNHTYLKQYINVSCRLVRFFWVVTVADRSCDPHDFPLSHVHVPVLSPSFGAGCPSDLLLMNEYGKRDEMPSLLCHISCCIMCLSKQSQKI